MRYNESMDKRKHQDMDPIYQIALNGVIIPYTVAAPRPNQVRIILRWDNGMLRVSAPRRTPMAAIQGAIERNREWVLAQQQTSPALDVLPLVPGDTISLRGTPWSIHLAETTVGMYPDQRCIFVPEAQPAIQHQVLYALIRQLAADVLPKRTWALATEHGLFPEIVRVREQRSRWGSCSTKRNIQLNWRLIQAPDRIVDYVIIHELAHLREMNHSQRFWSIVETIIPDWRQRRAWLKHHGNELFRLREDGWVQS
ncbi:hypothetical protein C7445_11170 [Alicyclobacillus sacchari]|uniref:YgjP-like metallopeptidase domain-containing protein n=2 Tax=Alicyclobacillus sacchari TaxID=392010 RepID=A0A4R8LJ15_9BACL|nr:hypothetical protein C7445_11170 [Alicyclobacillus sacchari]